MTELLDNNLCRIGVNRLVNRCHNPERHQFFNNFGAFFGHTVGKFLNRNNFGNNNFLNHFFLRLLYHCRFGLFLFETAARSAETVIIILIITDRMNIDFTAAALGFKTAFHNLFAFLLKSLFAAQRALNGNRFAEFFVPLVFILIIFFIKVFGFFFFDFNIAFFGRNFRRRRRHCFFFYCRLSGFSLCPSLSFFFFGLFLQLPLSFFFFFFLTAFGFVFFGFGNQTQLGGGCFVNLHLGSRIDGRRINHSFFADFNLNDFFAVISRRLAFIAQTAQGKGRFA